MARRVDIELTSKRDDDSWTWRAAGAKQPKGTVASSLLYEGASVGDVVRAEAEFELEGITVTTVYPPTAKKAAPANRIEVVGTKKSESGVTTSLVEKSARRGRDGAKRGREGERPDRPRRDRGERGERGEQQSDRGRRERPRREGRDDRPRRQSPDREDTRPKFKKLAPKNVHRVAVVEELPPEQRPIAEQILRGGIPAVRQALDAESAKARSEGRPPVNTEPLVTLAEQLLPSLKSAEWLDRAEAAKASVDEISIRDLRAVVTSADLAARTEEARALAMELRTALERRVNEGKEAWFEEIKQCLGDGRLVRALRLSARPPDPSVRFPADLAEQLSEAASAAMAPDVSSERWRALLDAVSASPVRSKVKPAGLPTDKDDELIAAAKEASGRVPALATMLGVSRPPPPKKRPPVPSGDPRPPKPEASAAPATAPDAAEASAEPAQEAETEAG